MYAMHNHDATGTSYAVVDISSQSDKPLRRLEHVLLYVVPTCLPGPLKEKNGHHMKIANTTKDANIPGSLSGDNKNREGKW